MTNSDLQPLPKTTAVSGVLEALSFFRDPNFASSRFEQFGDVYETVLFGQTQVFVRGERAISDLFAQADRLEGWWPGSVRELLGPFSLANRHGPCPQGPAAGGGPALFRRRHPALHPFDHRPGG